MRSILLPGIMATAIMTVLIAQSGTAAPSRPLGAQIKQLAKDLRDTLTTDPKLKGQKLQIGEFTQGRMKGTNFGLKLKRLLEQELRDFTAEEALLALVGRYAYVESESDTPQEDPTFKLHVVRITVTILDDKDKELAVRSVEVNESDDISEILGLTVSPNLHGGQKRRNLDTKEAFENPRFVLKAKNRVAEDAASPYSVEVLIKDKPDRASAPIMPVSQKGQAFVDVKPTQFYEIRLYNDTEFDAIASITIDGLDALNTFNQDKQKYLGYLVPAKGTMTVRGWLQTVDSKAKDNVLSFLVTEYGHGAATRFKSTGEIGAITIGFHAAWKEGQPLPPGEKGARSAGRETAAGPGLPENLEVAQRQVGLKRATVSIRYSPADR